MTRVLFLILFSIFYLVQVSYASHLRAGDITYKKVNDDPNDFQYEILITICSNSAVEADSDRLAILYGDEAEGAELDSIQRTSTIFIDPNSQLDFYRKLHTYPGPGTYLIQMEENYRNGGILNISQSDSEVFYLESMLVINPFLGHNNSVSLLYAAKDEACVNAIWKHNPGAFDEDGDSIAYSLVPCRGTLGIVIASWVSPESISGSNNVNDTFTINPLTGTITWDSPVLTGEYNMAIKIEEYRNGQFMGYVIRDMQIKVGSCPFEPPMLNLIQDTCVMAYEELEIFISSSDSEELIVEATGAPISELTNLAEFSTDTLTIDSIPGLVVGHFEWTPGCEEVRPASYQMLFSGQNSSPINNLVDIVEVNITVVSPPVDNFQVTANGSAFDITWNEIDCQAVFGYKIYRRIGEYGYEPGHCETGVPEYTGYELIATLDAPVNSYTDNDNTAFNIETCYMIVACFESGSESIATEETCAMITDLNVPIMTSVSVEETAFNLGENSVSWAAPLSDDTLDLVSPYFYRLYHGASFSEANDLIFESANGEFIASLTNDFIHSNVTTELTPNAYRVELVDFNGVVLSSNPSSSNFLTITPDDNKLLLTWDFDVSWLNVNYNIYRKTLEEASFTLLGSSSVTNYTDLNLINQQSYCYYIEAFGTFSSPESSLPEPTINLSQEVCSQPVDLTAPCPPELEVEGNCEDGEINMQWNNPNDSCADDVTGYYIYYKPFIDSEYTLIDSISNASETTYDYVNPTNITGCFYVTALDSVLPGIDGLPNQNESVPSEEFCFESCSEYILPNVITPQGDGLNDLFKPFPYQYIDSIDLVIYNRWGTPVFQTNDPDILWNGSNMDSGAMSAQGVYFYTISIFTSKLTGIMEEKRNGNFTILGGN